MATSDLSPQSEPQSSFAREVFLKYYAKLSNLRLEMLASHLVANKVINTDDHEAIRGAGTVKEKSAIILRAISSHLEVEETESFFLLLDLMELLGDFIMKKIAGGINRQLGRPSRGGGENEVCGDQPRRKEVDFTQLCIDSAFSTLTSNICIILKSHHGVDFYSLRRACFENVNTFFGASIPGELIDKIRSTDNLNDLFDVLALSPPYWSWINIRILKKMVDVSCLDEAKLLIERYQEAVFSMKLSQVLKKIPDTNIPPDYYTKVEEKWDRSLDAVTVKDLVTEWSKMEEFFNVIEPTLVLQKVVDGCVEIHWLIPTQLVHHVSSAVFNARHDITSILYLKINGHVILCNDEEMLEYTDTSWSRSIVKESELSQTSLVQYLYSSHTIRPSMVVQVFNSLVNHVVSQMLQCGSHKEYLHHCESLMASDAHKIGLFSEVQLKELDDCNDNSLLLQNLKSLWTWSDHSILEALASSCDEAVKLITQFDSRLNRSQLISAYPILTGSHDTAPDDNSPYTVLVITCDRVLYHSPLQLIFDMRQLVISKCDITAHCLQLLAARADPTVLYWSIPKCVVSLVITKVLEYRKAFHEEMISEVSIYPTTRIVTSSDRVLGSLVYLLPAVPAGGSSTEETSLSEASERAKLKLKWLSQPEVLTGVLDDFISDIKKKDEDLFQLKLEHYGMSKMYQHVIQKKGQLQADVKALERDVAEHKKLYEKKAKSFDELVMTEQEKKAVEQPSPPPPVEAEEAMKKVHTALHYFRACFQETIISYNVDTETASEKQWKTVSSSVSEEYVDPTTAKLLIISQEIMAATNDMGQNIELHRTVVRKLQEAETKVKELEAQATDVNMSKDKMLQDIVSRSGQSREKLEILKSQIVEHKKWCAENAKHFYEFVLTKKEQLRKELEQFCSTGKVEDTIKKLQVSWEDLRSCFEDTASRDGRTEGEELAEKQLKDSEDDKDLKTTLNSISQEIVKAKDWTSKLKERNLELQKALDEKSKEAEDMNIRLKQLETDDTNTMQAEELKKLKKENKLLLKKIADLRIDVTKPDKSHFGTGRYGETYKMNHKGTWCSAKVLHKTLLSSAKSNEDLVAGVKKFCSTLHHANLVAFIGVTEVDKRPAILTELMEANLFTFIQQNSELTLDIQASLCKDMCRGLEELHKYSLLHNNLHHRNVLIQDNRAKLTDYYYPLLQFEGTAPDYTDTAPFVAPEVIENRSNCSQSSDIYSLAVLCLKVITGKTAVQIYKQNVATIVQEHIFLPLLQQCLSDEVGKRPTAARIWDDIKTIQDSPQYISFKALKQKNSMPLFQAVKAGTKQLKWRTCATMPAPLVGANAVVLDNVIYVSGGESQDEFASRYVFAYHLLENRWEQLPQLTHSHGVPAVISNKLVIIGGKDCKSRRFTNQVSTYNHTELKWESVYPNLSKERFGPLVVTYKHYAIVGGGKYRAMPLYDRFYDDIEIINIEDDLIWRKVPTRLPAKMWCPSVTISNDQLWVVGFNNDNSGSLNLIEQRSEEIFWIPVTDVVSTDKKGKWEPLPRVVPYYSSTVVPYSSPIVTVGGDTEDTKTVCAIEMHNDSLGAWEQVASLKEPSRAYVTVACIGEQQAIIVLGGCTQTRNKRSRQDSSLALVQIGYGV